MNSAKHGQFLCSPTLCPSPRTACSGTFTKWVPVVLSSSQFYRIQVGLSISSHTDITTIGAYAGAGTLTAGAGGVNLANSGSGNTVIIFTNGNAGQEAGIKAVYGGVGIERDIRISYRFSPTSNVITTAQITPVSARPTVGQWV